MPDSQEYYTHIKIVGDFMVKARIYRLSSSLDSPSRLRCNSKRWRKFNKTRVKRLVLVVIICAMVCSVVKVFSYQSKTLKALEAQRADILRRIENVKTANNMLRDEKKLLDDIDYIERIARQEYGMVAPGEKIFVPAKPQDKDQ